MLKKIVQYSILCIFTPLISMQPHDVTFYRDPWTKIIALVDTEKNTLRSVCTALKNICSKNNCDIYLCSPLILSSSQQTYALGLAMYKRLPHVIENLCRNGANPQARLFDQPLTILAQYNDPLRATLHNRGIVITPSVAQDLVAAYFGDTDYLQAYCNKEGTDISEITITTGATALHLATIKGHTTIVELLLKHPSLDTIINKKNTSGNTPLAIAAYYGHLYITQLLFQHPLSNLTIYNDDDNDRYNNPLYVACQNGREYIVHFFIAHKPEWLHLYFNKNTPLHAAACRGHTHIISILLNHVPEQINQKNSESRTPLIIAAQQGHTEAVERLLQHNDIDTTIIYNGSTALDMAIEKNHTEIITLLCEHEAQTAQELDQIPTQESDPNTALSECTIA